MFFTAECLNRYLLVLSYQSYKNSRYLPDQSLTPAIITIRCTTTSLNREMLHQRYDNNYSTFWQSVKSKNLRKSYQHLTVPSVTVYLWPFRMFNHSWLLSPILKSLYLSAGLNALTVVKPMLCFLPSLCLIPRYPYRSRLLSYLLMKIPEILNRSWTELLLLMKILLPPSPNAI